MSKVVIVTGASSGIGRASAVSFAKAGCTVVVADIDAVGALKTCQQVTDAGGTAFFIQTDVTDESSIRSMVDQVRSKYGRLDYAHNNAGIEGDRAKTHEYSTDMFDRVMAVNARGVWLCMKYEIPLMLDTGNDGAIVNTSSTAGVMGMPEFSAYTASKHAIVGMAKSAAKEYAGKIRVNSINPGTTDTPMVQRFAEKWPDWQAATNASYPIARIAVPEEVAEGAVWLCTRATYMTGQTLVMDGGVTCCL
eukprot:jgi/Chrzof1/14021/Cz08g21120.t1